MTMLGRFTSLLALMLLTVTVAGNASAQTKPQTKAPTTAEQPVDLRARLAAARTWAYQLQNLKAAELARTTHDVFVLDWGGAFYGLKPDEIARLKRKPDGSRRIVLAYINIGEAEDYRTYWKKEWATSPPEWMGGANTRWKGDHRVRHWHPAWRDIVFGSKTSIIGQVMSRSFDGVYMDRVDIWQFWCGERPTTFDDMVTFVDDISRWAKAQKPGFLIVPQNAEELLQSDRYRAVIDGIGKEDFLFGDRGNEVANFDTRIARMESLLALATKDKLPVFAIEYARNPDNQKRAIEHHGRLGHVLYFGPRSLAYLGQKGPANKEDGDSEPYHAAQGPLACGG